MQETGFKKFSNKNIQLSEGQFCQFSHSIELFYPDLCANILFFFIILFIYFGLHWVFALHGLSLVAVSGGYSSLCCAGFSLWQLPLLWYIDSRHMGSVLGLTGPRARLSSCGPQTQLLSSMWNLHGPGIKPMSPALVDGLLTTALPGQH